jgi:hypothetical protein
MVAPRAFNPEAEGAPRDLQFAAVAWNTRDHLLNPTQRLLLRGRVTHTNTALLFEVRFVRGCLTSGARKESVSPAGSKVRSSRRTASATRRPSPYAYSLAALAACTASP